MKFYFFIFIFCFYGLIFSNSKEYSIKGQVIDSSTSLGIDKVNIISISHDLGTSTDENGEFMFDNLNLDEYKLQFSHLGYEKKQMSIHVSKHKNIIIQLNKTSLLYDPIMVTGVNIDRPLSDSPIITEVISRNEIERYSSATVIELLEKVVPNIQVKNDSHGTTMNIQGLDSKYFLFLVNGNRMTGETTGNIDFSRLNTSNIERIEILNGGASTSYGSGAIGGVINIITKYNELPYLINAGSKLYSKNNDQNSWVTLGFSNKYFNSQTNYTNKSSNGYSINNEIIQNRFNDISLNQILRFNPISNLKIYTSATYYEHDTEDYNYNNKRRDKYYDKQLILNIDYGKLENFLIKFKWNRDEYNKFTLFEALNDQERMRSSHTLNLFNVNALKSSSNNNFVLGIENYNESFYSPTDLSYNPFAGYLGFDSLRSTEINSYFLQHEYKVSDKIILIGGLRYDIHSTFGDHLGPHLSVLYKKNNFNFRFNSSRNFKAPTLKELYMSWDHLGMFYVNGNNNLRPEISKYVSSSIEFIKPSYNLTFKSYIHILDNMIALIEDFQSDQMIYKNFQSVRITGLDLYYKSLIFKNYTFNTTISYIKPFDISNNRQLDGTNKLAINSNLIVYLFNKSQSFNLNYKFLSETYYFEESIPNYYIINFSHNWEINNYIKISSGIDNLKNTASMENRTTVYPDQRYFINISILVK